MKSRQPRSMLFVSGEKVERFAKAMAAGADLVCIDLEDAVHPDRKAEALGQVLGGADLSAELDAQFNWDGLLSARGRLVNAAKSAGVQAWDVPNVDLSSDEGLATETRKALALGFGCKTAIHPQQIKTIHAAFTPTPAEIEWATVLLQAVPEGQGSGAFLFQGKMVDAPLLKKARRIAELARASS